MAIFVCILRFIPNNINLLYFDYYLAIILPIEKWNKKNDKMTDYEHLNMTFCLFVRL